jgi:hypothetical protein
MSSSGKFASITGDLLARKGEARPWNGPAPADEDLPAPLAWRSPVAQPMPTNIEEPPPPAAWRPAVAAPPPPPSEAKDRSCTLRMSAHDYERLGILAVKQGVNRQQLLKQALADFLAARAAQYGCACLGACNSNCGNGC